MGPRGQASPSCRQGSQPDGGSHPIPQRAGIRTRHPGSGELAHEVRGVRPAVISPDLYRKLGDYLSFRHVGRHAYGYELRWEKMRRLVESLPLVAAQLAEELEVFRRGIAELETDL